MRLAPGWRRRNGVALALALISATLLATVQVHQSSPIDRGTGLTLAALDSVIQDLALESRIPESY